MLEVIALHKIAQASHQKIQQLKSLKSDVARLGIGLLLILIALQIVFYKESLGTIIKIALALYYLYIIPGFCVMLYWQHRLDFIERFIVGTMAGLGLIAILSYFTGMFGISIIYHNYIFPPIIIVVGLALYVMRDHKEEKQ